MSEARGRGGPGADLFVEDLEPFDITDPLPTGTTLLEASAGTGKTWTIGALVTRFVAEGEARLEEMLVVTFGRAASQELRERVRAQLVEAEQALADPAAPHQENDLIELLLTGTQQEVAERRHNLREALGSFDAATIATTHQFCQLVLRSLGVAGDTDSSARLVEDLDDLLVEVVDDLYLRGFADAEDGPLFSRSEALSLARAAVGDPQARLEPTSAEPSSKPGRRLGFARAVRAEMDRRKRRLGVLSYDDLLSQLAHALDEEDAPARARMRQRWKVVLVDEFQDTDPVQWQVLDRAFTGHARMVLIGDPKQAIYAFRGGDVVTYLAAAATADTRKTLATNWRADQPLLSSLQTVLDAAELGDPRIVVRPVEAAHDESRLVGAPDDAPFRLRVVRREQFNLRGAKGVPVGRIRPLVARDCAHDIKNLLTSGATYDGRPIAPGDVAVLAHTGKSLQLVREALHEIGVPAVVAGGGSVFATPAAVEWLTLLEALEQPHRSARVRSAALTSFLGIDAVELDADEDLTDRVASTMREWAELFSLRGVAAVMEAAVIGGLYARVLSRVDGERHLTDLRHVAQALHQAALVDRLGLVAVLTWLRDQMADDKVQVASERTRRLDSDAAAVQLVTIHGSKGLEYPVVHLPFVADRFSRDPAIPLFHAPSDEQRCIDVGSGGDDWRGNVARHKAEDLGESLRLLYVAMTRAQSQVVAWWAPSNNAKTSALHRMLIGRGPSMSAVPPEVPLSDDDATQAFFDAWQRHGGPTWLPAVPAQLTDAELPRPGDDLSARTFDRSVDTAWRRTSYSALSSVDTVDPVVAGVASEPEETPREDEPDVPQVVSVAGSGGFEPFETARTSPPQEPTLAGARSSTTGGAVVPSPMGELPVGATFGSLVHGVLETADPSAPDFRAELLVRVREQLVRWPVELDPAGLAEALIVVCESPLGPLAGDATLRAIPMADRLCELEFELPLSGGDEVHYPTEPVRLGDVAPLLRRHLPAGDPLLPYAEALADPNLGGQDLRGYLTGSVDVVLRIGGTFLIVDYKTNWLGGFDEALTSADYRPEALEAAMGHSDYPLQALLYAVVLHRYLRWRLADYDPSTHLGGVLYLYLRGMCGPDTPTYDGHPTGVFSWRPPVALVEALSDLLDGVAP
ncbi:UvrD-helicase domain-containing protein [Nocardioides sp. JQ2195]|uniref:UvrD-helicase domain-containing protein n=1 Tax=Nocardioides sp. JQ2195 TaxID=2592334 RepID=UPI00143E4352|nr:UvrD-helicase domain-containing protein [Nocardioides sp. JQ2195]QIX25272.1 UvrD-helicase domain-containing protein [Nocardioides sp. JQ2195]